MKMEISIADAIKLIDEFFYNLDQPDRIRVSRSHIAESL